MYARLITVWWMATQLALHMRIPRQHRPPRWAPGIPVHPVPPAEPDCGEPHPLGCWLATGAAARWTPNMPPWPPDHEEHPR